MSERMKEMFLFISIGCAGVVGMELAMILAQYIIDGPSKELADHALAIVVMFFWAMLWGAIAYKFMRRKTKKELTMKEREKIISGQMYTITTLMILVAMIMIICIIRRLMPGIIFSGAFVFALFCWDIGCALADNIIHRENKE